MRVCTPCRQPRQHPTTQFFTGRMPFLTPNQQRQSTEGTTIHTHTHTTILLLFWNLSGTTRVSRYQKGKTREVKTNLDLLEQEIVSGSGIWWAICNAYSLRPPAKSPPCVATHGFTSHSTHPQSSSLHGAVKAGSLSEIAKRALPPELPEFIPSNLDSGLHSCIKVSIHTQYVT